VSRDPLRLAELSEEAAPDDAFMRSVIRAERTELPSDAKMAELAARLGPIVTKNAGPLTPSWKWLVIAALAGTFTVGAVLVRARSGRELASSPPSPASVIAVAPLEGNELAPAAAPPAPVISIDALPSVSAPRRARAAPSMPSCEREIDLVDGADAALRAGDATRALDLARTHAERCPSGAFVQERERIAIEALARLGRQDEVRERARAFESRFPSSAHLRRVRSLVEE
jgi:hypothetical protein